MRRTQLAGFLLAASATLLPLVSNTEPGERLAESSLHTVGVHENLQVLPKDIGRGRLGNIMLGFLSGLGLPRRAGEGCLHCHAGSLDLPRDEWDYASDAKPAKKKARVMLAMVQAINDTHLDKLATRSKPALEVSCITCHAGRLNPAPLLDVLGAEYASGGIDALERSYGELHARYYESDAYDFRARTLIAVGDQLESQGKVEDAIRVHQLNAEYSADPAAMGGEILVLLREALSADGSRPWSRPTMR